METKTLMDFITELGVKYPSLQVAFFQKAVDQYKAMREEKTKLFDKADTLQIEIEEVKAKTDNAKDLFRIQERLDYELKKFGELSNDPDLNQKTSTLKARKLSQIMKILHSIKAATNSISDKVTRSRRAGAGDFIVAKGLFFPIFLIFIITLAVYILTENEIIVTAGFITLLLNMFLLVMVNSARDFNFRYPVTFGEVDYENSNNKTYEKFINELNKRDGTFFVNAAWVDALRKEKFKIGQAITRRMGGHSFEEITQNILVKENEIEASNLKINAILDTMISAEEYLKLRRELDIQKIEKESSSRSNREKPTSAGGEKPSEIRVSSLESLDQRLKGIIMSYLEYLKGEYSVVVE